MKLYQIKQAFMGLRATKLFTLINIAGLVLGFTCTLILGKYVYQEWMTNKFNSNFDNLYYSTINATPLSKPKLLSASDFFQFNYNEYPEVEAYSTIHYDDGAVIKCDERKYRTSIMVADTAFTRLFDYSVQSGTFKEILKDPASVVVTRKMASKLFGNENPVGKSIEYTNKSFTIAGVLNEPSTCSSMKFDFIFPAKAKKYWLRGGHDYILLKPEASIDEFNSKVVQAGQKHPQYPDSRLGYLPFSELYFSNQISVDSKFYQFGNRQNIYVLLIISILIFLISTFNFVNIYIVTLHKRGKELGVRKVLGARNFNFTQTFLFEIFIAIALATALSFLLFYILTPFIHNLTGKELLINPGQDMLIFFVACVLLTLITASFPAFKYTRVSPIKSIKEMGRGKRVSFIRKLSMAAQYVVAISLIIVSLFFIKQLNFMLNKDLGYNKENIIKVRFFEKLTRPEISRNDPRNKKARKEYREKYKAYLKDVDRAVSEIEKNPYLHHICFGRSPAECREAPWRNINGEDDYVQAFGLSVTPNFVNLYGLEVVDGRFFEQEKDKSRSKKVVINEEARKLYNIQSLDDAWLGNRYWGGVKRPFKVIGVIKDFNFQHLSRSTQPLVMFFHDDKVGNYFMCHITPGKEQESIAFLKELFYRFNPNKTFEYSFVEDQVAELYSEDKEVARIYSLFAIIAMVISSMGLFSFSVYDVQQRIKEIGIRKVNGSSVHEIIIQLTWKFIKLISISFVVAIPLALWSIDKYLENFAFKTPITWGPFVFAALFTFSIALLTLFWQSYKAATRNPVEALRYE